MAKNRYLKIRFHSMSIAVAFRDAGALNSTGLTAKKT